MAKVAKCYFCRKDKKKCTWSLTPGSTASQSTALASGKCDWCIKSRFPCSQRRFANDMRTQIDILDVLEPRLNFRSTVEIVRDFDCGLYLLAGILDYNDHPINTTVIYDGPELLPPGPTQGLETTMYSQWIPGISPPRYQIPNNADALHQNLAIFNQIQNFCKNNLQAVLEKLRKEGGATVEYLASKNRFYEATALANLMVLSPISYTTKSIEKRNFDRSSTESPYLRILIENEKNSGQLLYHIKSATIPSVNYPAVYKSAVQYGDIESAQAILQNFIEKHLLGTLLRNEGESESYSSTIYHKIDPLAHRTCFWAENGNTGYWSLQSIGITTMAMERNLLGETGLCVARKYGFNNPELAAISQHSIKTDETTTDVRGCGIVLATALAGHWDETVFDIIREAKTPKMSAFFSRAEVPGLEKIQKSFPGLHPNHWSYLDPYQLVTLMGNLGFIQQVEAFAPGFFAQTYNKHHKNEDNSIYGYLSGIFPELTLGEYHPVILSALAGYTEITRYHLEKNPELSKLQTNSWGGKLGALFLIAFKRGDLELLDLLNEVAPFELSSSERVVLSRQAAELAAPIVFQTWVNLAWFDLGGFTWGADSVRCELWRAILQSLYSRYEGTQGTEDRDIQNEKACFVDVIWGLEQSMYLARCGCPSCEEHYLRAHQVLSSFDQN
ncbi:hypothetical protein TWF569_010970 [Orbilia oligospora]|nr:hypothetical protein TWF594_003915 [Orbilia oligospora]KAF3132095.1 hypothetical protein TWF569_010970 [Orbilia oligospora]